MSTVRRRRAALLEAIRAKKRQRRQRVVAVLAVVIAVSAALLVQDCAPKAAELAHKAATVPKTAAARTHRAVPIVQEPAVTAPSTEPDETMARLDRPELSLVHTSAPPWLAEFQRQVSARGPDLAACFVGVDGPGRLEWTTTVSGLAGRVSDHSLTPVTASTSLSSAERSCLLEVLSRPRYDLGSIDRSAAPARVRLMIAY